MTQRERNMAVIVGGFMGLAVVYWLINAIYLGPIENARIDHANKLKRLDEIRKLVDSESSLVRRWNGIVSRTLSFESNKVRDWFGVDLKNIVQRHGFEGATFRPAGGSRLGSDRKHPIIMQGCRISVTGDYIRVVDLVNDIYKTPYVCKITELSLTPLGPRMGRDLVKADITVETPVMPRIGPNISTEAARAVTIDHDAMAALPPVRRDLLPDEMFSVLDERNILREYMAPPAVTVTIDNEDWKTVAVTLDFYWEGNVIEQMVETVAGNSQKAVSGRGEQVEVRGTYADSTAFGPRKISFGSNRTEFYKVAAHTPPKNDVVMLAVDNQDAKDVLVDVTVTMDDGKTITYPPMVITAGKTVDVGEWKAGQIAVAARYASGKPAGRQTYEASTTKHTMLVVKEPEQVVIDSGDPTPVDPPPDDSLTVSGLLTYRHVHEMVVTNGSERRVIKSGEPGAVDGGTLVGVHPSLGGVVQMPGTGNYYIYPLGQSFGKRFRLDTREESELASAIDRWTRHTGGDRPEGG